MDIKKSLLVAQENTFRHFFGHKLQDLEGCNLSLLIFVSYFLCARVFIIFFWNQFLRSSFRESCTAYCLQYILKPGRSSYSIWIPDALFLQAAWHHTVLWFYPRPDVSTFMPGHLQWMALSVSFLHVPQSYLQLHGVQALLRVRIQEVALGFSTFLLTYTPGPSITPDQRLKPGCLMLPALYMM